MNVVIIGTDVYIHRENSSTLLNSSEGFSRHDLGGIEEHIFPSPDRRYYDVYDGTSFDLNLVMDDFGNLVKSC